jgi:hypothetical protein
LGTRHGELLELSIARLGFPPFECPDLPAGTPGAGREVTPAQPGVHPGVAQRGAEAAAADLVVGHDQMIGIPGRR